MAVDAASFKLLLPEFAEEEDDRVTLFLAMAARRISVDAFGSRYDDAQTFLTAHLLSTMNAAGSDTPAVVSETVGSISRTYADASGSTGEGLASTSYGAEYLNLLRLLRPTPAVL